MSPRYDPQEVFEPAMFYHPRKGAQFVKDENLARTLLTEGWTKRYHHQEYPVVLKHQTLGKKLVSSKEEHDKLGAGWEMPGHEAAADVSVVRDPTEGAEEQKAELQELKSQVSILTTLLTQALGQATQPEPAPKPSKK